MEAHCHCSSHSLGNGRIRSNQHTFQAKIEFSSGHGISQVSCLGRVTTLRQKPGGDAFCRGSRARPGFKLRCMDVRAISVAVQTLLCFGF